MEFSMLVEQLLIAGEAARKDKEALQKRRDRQNAQKKKSYNNRHGTCRDDFDEDDDE